MQFLQQNETYFSSAPLLSTYVCFPFRVPCRVSTLACAILPCSCLYMWHAILINRSTSRWGNSVFPVHLTAIPSPFTVKWARLSLPELRCRFMPEQCRFLHIRWKPCLHIPARSLARSGSLSLSLPPLCSLFPPLSLSSFFLRRHFNMYANGLRSTGKICVESCPAVRRCRRDCVCIYEAWALPLLGEETLRVAWWRLCSAGRMQICQ